jgi:hypothetical protein
MSDLRLVEEGEAARTWDVVLQVDATHAPLAATVAALVAESSGFSDDITDEIGIVLGELCDDLVRHIEPGSMMRCEIGARGPDMLEIAVQAMTDDHPWLNDPTGVQIVSALTDVVTFVAHRPSNSGYHLVRASFEKRKG